MRAFQNTDARVAAYAADCAAWEKQTGRADPGNKGFADGWAAPGFDASGWKTIKTSQLLDWRSIGLSDGGAVWLRKTVTLPPNAAGKDFTLTFGEIPGADTAYFNGEEVGHGGWNAPNFYREPRKYPVPRPSREGRRQRGCRAHLHAAERSRLLPAPRQARRAGRPRDDQRGVAGGGRIQAAADDLRRPRDPAAESARRRRHHAREQLQRYGLSDHALRDQGCALVPGRKQRGLRLGLPHPFAAADRGLARALEDRRFPVLHRAVAEPGALRRRSRSSRGRTGP